MRRVGSLWHKRHWRSNTMKYSTSRWTTLFKIYFQGATSDDIAILQLADEVDLAQYHPVCLPRKSDGTTFDGKTALAIGELNRSVTC